MSEAKKTTTTLKFDVVKNVTLPLLKQQDDTTVYIQITGEIFTGKEMKGSGDKQKMEPADLMNIVDLETGEEMQMIANAVLKSTLEEEYPEAAYVGKQFAITRNSVEGKRYKTYKVQEIRVKV